VWIDLEGYYTNFHSSYFFTSHKFVLVLKSKQDVRYTITCGEMRNANCELLLLRMAQLFPMRSTCWGYRSATNVRINSQCQPSSISSYKARHGICKGCFHCPVGDFAPSFQGEQTCLLPIHAPCSYTWQAEDKCQVFILLLTFRQMIRLCWMMNLYHTETWRGKTKTVGH